MGAVNSQAGLIGGIFYAATWRPVPVRRASPRIDGARVRAASCASMLGPQVFALFARAVDRARLPVLIGDGLAAIQGPAQGDGGPVEGKVQFARHRFLHRELRSGSTV